jgi:outer membrane protein TolC
MQRVLVILFATLILFTQGLDAQRQSGLAQSGLASAAGTGEALSLRDAVNRALQRNPSLEAMQARERAAASQVDAARSGYLPRVNYQEMVQRGNNPVFVFSSLLTQRQFTERNFAISSLTRPDFVNNFQSMVTVDQVVFNAGRTGNAIQGAKLGQEMESLGTRSTELTVMQRVLEAYLGAKLGESAWQAAEESVKSATADLERAEAFRKEGLTTDADVLSIRVYLASVKQEAIQRRTQLEVARAALNVAMGAPEESMFQLTTPLVETVYEARALEASQQSAVGARPELLQAIKGMDLARLQEKQARSGYWPEVFVRGVFETDRQEVLNKGGANWFFGAGLRWNIFNGMETKAKVAETRHRVAVAEAQKRHAESGVRFEVRRAWLEWNAVKERLALASASVAQAEESLRITRDRYQNGLTTVTDLLRTETTLLGARTGYLAALYDQRLAAARLEAAQGSLTPNSALFD